MGGSGPMKGMAKSPIGSFVALSSRMVQIDMTDNAFNVPGVFVKPGETVSFVIRNGGDVIHEFNVGTAQMHRGHQKEMAAMMAAGKLEADRIVSPMSHAHNNSVLLEPGKTAVLTWKFSKAGNIEFACNVPGHYEAGMKGKFHFREDG